MPPDPKTDKTSSPGIEHESSKDQELAKILDSRYDKTNKIFSDQCNNCYGLFYRFVWKDDPLSPVSQTTQIEKTYAGDWKWLKNIFGLTGPDGRHFLS